MKTYLKFIYALRELGLSKLWYFARYQIGLRSGYYRRVTPSLKDDYPGEPGLPPLVQVPQVSQVTIDLTLATADEVCRGKVRLFGGEPVPLNLDAGASNAHWTHLERRPPEEDLKVIWEPARFGWAITLARAFAFSRDPKYATAFWEKTQEFLNVHPPNTGRQWQSAQEVAIRLMALVFCDRVLADAPASTPENRRMLWTAIAEHAARIPPTLAYARAQNNNHLLAEAAGLYTAGIYLPTHPQAGKWRQLGWRWLNWGFQHQISETGTYMQHSVNYHRLMLQLALFTDHLRREAGDADWPAETLTRLAAGTRWLWALADPDTGAAPNLGANDGAYLFPLTAQPYPDYRPVVDAAGRAFLGLQVYQQGELHEMGDWFDLELPEGSDHHQPQAPDMLRVASGEGRGFLRAAQFSDRPSHADQLHVDLWWRGVNVALDPGTYHYNAPSPWDNALQSSKVHNTLTVDGQEQMTLAGRFLWLQWAQADVLGHTLGEDGQSDWVKAEHDGYAKLRMAHQRKLSRVENGWAVEDAVNPYGEQDARYHEVCLTWLLPDWDWAVEGKDTLRVTGPEFGFTLHIAGADHFYLFKGGETVLGTMPAKPAWGWYSPTYGVKVPTLLLVAVRIDRLPMLLTSTWQFFD
ncbi:MAG: alginate lyase family protein [Brevefilum sp.]